MRFLAFIVLLSALAIAGCAAFFSIIGLKLLFVGGGLSIVVMGIALEVGKLVAATFLKQKWKEISVWMRTYMVIATLLLVAITSIGIYGFLTAGYTATSGTVQGYERQIELNILKIQELEKEVLFFRTDTYNEAEIGTVNETRKKFSDQRLALVEERNAQIAKIRSDAKVVTTTEDISSAKQALDLAKAGLDADTKTELDQIKLYNARLEILDKEVQKWLDEGRGNIFRKGGLDKARETKTAQKAERDEIDAQIKKSQDRIDTLRVDYAGQVKEYNNRVATVESRNKDQRGEVDASIKRLEKENADTMTAISLYNNESDSKLAALNTKRGELVEQTKGKVIQNQATIQELHTKNDELRQNVVHTDVGTFKFIAKSLDIPLDKAVNYFVWMIMIVFDPLAVCLILAFNILVGNDAKTPTPKSIKPLKTTTRGESEVVGEVADEVVGEVADEADEPAIISPEPTEAPIAVVETEKMAKLPPLPPPPIVPYGISSGRPKTIHQ